MHRRVCLGAFFAATRGLLDVKSFQDGQRLVKWCGSRVIKIVSARWVLSHFLLLLHICVCIYIYVYIYMYIFLCVVCPIQVFEAHIWDMHAHMFMCFRVPCVHANMYYVCGRVVGMDVGFVKLVHVRHPL